MYKIIYINRMKKDAKHLEKSRKMTRKEIFRYLRRKADDVKNTNQMGICEKGNLVYTYRRIERTIRVVDYDVNDSQEEKDS